MEQIQEVSSPTEQAALEIVHLGYEGESKTFCGLNTTAADWWSAPYEDGTAAGEQDCVVCADMDAQLEASEQ